MKIILPKYDFVLKMLEEDENRIREIYGLIKEYPQYDDHEIYGLLKQKKERTTG